MTNNNRIIRILGGVALLLTIGLLYQFTSKGGAKQIRTPSRVVPNVSNNAIPTSNTIAQDPQDIVPGLYKNPIQNTSTQEAFTITASQAENNTDQTGKVIDDHLELTLKNTTGKDLSNFEVYYTITDATANIQEGYSKKLPGFVLKKGNTQTIHFDNKSGDGHFSANKQSVYYKSSNQVIFDVTVSSPGYKAQTVQVTKAAGGAEVKD